MKKLLLLLTLTGVTVFASCQADEEDNDLVGTTWECDFGDLTYAYTFVSNNTAHGIVNGDHYNVDEILSYTYSPPNVVLKHQDGSRETGVISGNVMTLDGDQYVKR